MQQSKPIIEIPCPKCAKKAIFHSNEWGGSYIYRPSKEGIVKCSYCGYNKSFLFSSEHYYYKIAVGKRYLYARTRKNLIFLRNYFANTRYKNFNDPGLDYPKSFYKNRLDIVRKIDNKLKADLNS